MNETKILATVNGKEITDKDVYSFLNQLAPQTAAQFSTPDGINQLANELVNGDFLLFRSHRRWFYIKKKISNWN